ncbi:MAG: tRNA lysidine(34) synthetase TilS [Propionibacteriaceae bacterium]|nr:tRNA lysidine(34) synthetase TilS [Propionibacteriaceae bacterium]
MARRRLSPDCLALVRAVEEAVAAALRETGLERIAVGLSGGPDSLALTAALAWAAGFRPPSSGYEGPSPTGPGDHQRPPEPPSQPDTGRRQATVIKVRPKDAARSGGSGVSARGGAGSDQSPPWTLERPAGPLAGAAIRVHIVDHGLQAGSAAAAGRAADQARRLGLDARVTRVRVVETGDGLEADARRARYDALLSDQAELVLVAHTLDDQAETVLLGLARGSGVRSLAGMPPRLGRLVRPLLGLRREQTVRACRDWGLAPWLDPMNQDPRHTRVRLRHGLDALEAALGPGLPQALARTAELARGDADLLDALAEEASAQVAIGPGLGAARLAALAPALRGRVILAWLRRQGSEAGLAQVQAVERLATAWRGQAGTDVPGGRVVRQDGRLLFRPGTGEGLPADQAD